MTKNHPRAKNAAMIKNVAIVGAGALGLMYASALEKILGAGVWFCAEGTRLEALRSSTFDLNGSPCRFAAFAPADIPKSPDLVLVAVKNYHLESVMPVLAALSGPQTLFLSVLNGISSEEEIVRAVPGARVALCTVQAMDAHKEGRVVTWSRCGTIHTGLRDSREQGGILEQLRAVEALFAQCGIPASPVADMRRRLWSKWMLNIGVNQVSALTGATFGRFVSDPWVRSLFLAAMEEVLLVSRAMDTGLTREDLEAWLPVIASLSPLGKTSMLQDVEQGRRTEVDFFAGTLLELAGKSEVDTPVNRVLYQLIKARETS